MIMKTIFLQGYFKILIAGTFVIILACTSPQDHRNPALTNSISKTYTMEVRKTDSVTIYWNAPPWDPDTVQYYELFYHPSKDTNWTLLKNNIPPSINPQAVVHRSEISATDSLFYFGVKYMSADGIESSIHASIDTNANPPGGWFMLWTK